MPCTRHRVFLAALVCAAKYLNDSTPKNKDWAIHACVFKTAEINLMEKQMVHPPCSLLFGPISLAPSYSYSTMTSV